MAKRVPKLPRLRQEKEKLEQKIVELQAQIMVLDDEIQKQEDIEIIGAVRSTSVSLEELKALLGLAAAQNSDSLNTENEAPEPKPEAPAQTEQREEEQEP